MPTIIEQTTFFTIDDIPSDTPAWTVQNTDVLLRPADRRGPEGVVIVGAHGRLAQKMMRDASTRLLNWGIYGEFDHEGNPHPTGLEGVEANLQYLVDNVYAIPDNDDSTRTLVLHLPSGATRSGPVQIRSLDWTTAGVNLLAVMEIYLPEGELVEDGS